MLPSLSLSSATSVRMASALRVKSDEVGSILERSDMVSRDLAFRDLLCAAAGRPGTAHGVIAPPSGATSTFATRRVYGREPGAGPQSSSCPDPVPQAGCFPAW